ncbi:hypothetical protein [Psychrobacter sp.]|uniref:hypothetical protein n=1 Tax=Psychrobacter sp. TaxID=56811 RepID=UPI0025D7226F|nr:hypothetical protein [Psychrobacter sp.]
MLLPSFFKGRAEDRLTCKKTTVALTSSFSPDCSRYTWYSTVVRALDRWRYRKAGTTQIISARHNTNQDSSENLD